MDGYLYIFLISIIPWLELRGSIPIGILTGLDFQKVFITSVLGGILIIPVMFILLDHIFPVVRKIDQIDRLYNYWETKVQRKYKKYTEWELIGLMIFVAIPLPGTGVYSGTLLSYLLGLDRKWSYLAIGLGALIAGIIVSIISLGLDNIF
ncbi:MAG: putative small multi-drug export protein [Candidatus Methanofastidiosum methylothiophilum]|uniref:Putative small multi-drug export protein n=1 Tax=Candidatus Methanofastidiosum methylothiophilum TaxID=1705564 RepID=A0A150J6E7_9EURY|nr:MAG: putative small multi-drug export protein [Candidatus Methanofastidiosum methylthiophilus]NMC76829.1 small multi-drug export protein [Candidatus Methanofastidiosa archaeon]